MLLRDHRASTSRKRECCKRRHAAIKSGEQRWGQPCFSAPTELIGDGEERFGPELLVCAVARLLYWSPVVDAALFPRSLPRLTCSCPVVEELPGHEIDGEYAKDQQHLQEESTNQGKR